MTKHILNIFMCLAMLGGSYIQAKADPIVEVNVVDFNQVLISYANGVLHVVGANGSVVSVYNIVGQKVYEARIDGNDKRIELNLPSNCYIVKVGTVARKISVKR